MALSGTDARQKKLIVGSHDAELLADERSRRYFDEIQYYLEIKDSEKQIVLCHYPMASGTA